MSQKFSNGKRIGSEDYGEWNPQEIKKTYDFNMFMGNGSDIPGEIPSLPLVPLSPMIPRTPSCVVAPGGPTVRNSLFYISTPGGPELDVDEDSHIDSHYTPQVTDVISNVKPQMETKTPDPLKLSPEVTHDDSQKIVEKGKSEISVMDVPVPTSVMKEDLLEIKRGDPKSSPGIKTPDDNQAYLISPISKLTSVPLENQIIATNPIILPNPIGWKLTEMVKSYLYDDPVQRIKDYITKMHWVCIDCDMNQNLL